MKVFTKNGVVVAGSVVGSVLVSSSAFAVDAAGNTAITEAFTAGGISVGVVVAGVIAIAAAMTGLGLIYGWLKK